MTRFSRFSAAMPVLLIAGCGDALPTGETALREFIPAMTGAGPDAMSERMAIETVGFTVSMTAGFAGKELADQWSEDVVAKKVADAFEPHRKAAADAFYAALAKELDAETTKALVADVRDPAKLKILKCAYKPDGFVLAFEACDPAAMGKPEDFYDRYAALRRGVETAIDAPGALGAAGTAACDVSDEFLAAARKANPDFSVGNLKMNRNGKEYDCATFRSLAGAGDAAAK
ncbi:MAG TPA: hypothetical protein PKD48_11605 [Sphingopyxis sp.]|nr:hypothetical protein [Sphingopyxis sp.]HMQ19018.1 hypothetical protein [Sphingopyxis sp.]